MFLIKALRSRFTMTKIAGSQRYDNIGSLTFYKWKDCYDNEYLAESRFGMRVLV